MGTLKPGSFNKEPGFFSALLKQGLNVWEVIKKEKEIVDEQMVKKGYCNGHSCRYGDDSGDVSQCQ